MDQSLLGLHAPSVPLVCGPSLKAALDRDWDQQRQKVEALELVLQVLSMVQAWVETLAIQRKKPLRNRG